VEFWRADSRLAVKEITRLPWPPSFHYCVHESPLLDLVLSQLTLIHFLSIYQSILLKSVSAFISQVAETLPFWSSAYNFVCISHFLTCVVSVLPIASTLLHSHCNIWWKIQITKVSPFSWYLLSYESKYFPHHLITYCTDKSVSKRAFNWAPRHEGVLGE
jgi:hypothetical protein